MIEDVPHAGDLLQDWRRRRRLSQLALASEAGVSQRHLSFVESGRAVPSRDMVLRLAEHLRVPLRERNAILIAAGHAPAYPARTLGEAGSEAAREAVDLLLKAHEPNPAIAIDRHWTLVQANAAVAPLLADVGAALLAPPVNVLRLSLHPDGLARRIVHFRDWRAHVLARLSEQIDTSGDAALVRLLEELRSYPVPANALPPQRGGRGNGLVVPFELETAQGRLSFISTTTVFGTALDVTLSELAIESFLPADPQTADILRRLAGRG